MNRNELYEALSKIGIVLHECNKEDNPPFDDSIRKYWLQFCELQSLYDEEFTNIYKVALQIIPNEYIDHHDTDLYIKVTDTSKQLVKRYAFRKNVETFSSAIPPYGLWFDIPFAYTPQWEKLLNNR